MTPADNSIKVDDLPEEAVVAIWWALREIKKEYLATPSGEQVYIRFTGSVRIIGQPKTVPDIEEQKQAVRILEKIGALKIDQFTHSGSTKTLTYVSPTGVYLNVLQPEFDAAYEKCRKLSTKSLVEDGTQTIDQEIFKPEIDKWLDDLSSNSLRNLSKILLVLRQFHEESGKDKFQIPYQQLHDAGVEGSIQNWLKNLHQKGVITIINWENKVNGSMPFSVEAPYDENETDHIYSGAKIEIHLEKFTGAYLWLKGNHYIKDENKETTTSDNQSEAQQHQSANQRSFFSSYKLIFNPDDGITNYRGADYQFIGKSKALLVFLSTSKNTTFPLEEIKAKCNPNITNKRSYFKGDKDMRDTVNYIKKQLKVKRGEFFPIKKQDNNWIWIEK